MLELNRIFWTRLALGLASAAVTVWLFFAAGLAFVQQAPAVAALFAAIAADAPVAEGQQSPVTAALYAFAVPMLEAAIVPAILTVVLRIVAAVIRSRDRRRRDPLRRFTSQQRREGMTRAGGRCEMEAAFWRRCTRRAEQGDHFYPWSKGGSTTVLNFVAACPRCNGAKAARIPTPWTQRKLENRRLAYVASPDAARVGERQELPVETRQAAARSLVD
ncbi:HNH endonuclease [Arthrobacter sp. PAMC25284]|nr:HNH endonuclease [Arthrobacter sp. PAMC25284]